MSEEGKQPHFISTKLLDALGGKHVRGTVADEDFLLVDQGAGLWGLSESDTERKRRQEAVLRHSGLTSRLAYFLGKDLKGKPGFENINLGYLVHGAVLHDITKAFGADRENLPVKIKKALGIPADFREISDETDEIGISWLKNLGFPPEVYEAIRGHDFPEQIVNNPYWKIILVADYMAGQRIMTVEERLNDVRTRWIDQPMAKNQPPRIKPERFEQATKNIKTVAQEIFGALGTTDEDFIEKNQLNSDKAQTRWERFLLTTAAKGKEEKAKKLVKLLIG